MIEKFSSKMAENLMMENVPVSKNGNQNVGNRFIITKSPILMKGFRIIPDNLIKNDF